MLFGRAAFGPPVSIQAHGSRLKPQRRRGKLALIRKASQWTTS
jgi:hypothetical protein